MPTTKQKTKTKSSARRSRAARLNKATLDRLQQLSEAVGMSGDEGAIRKLVMEAIEGHAEQIEVDTMGNVLATKKSRKRSHVLAAAHMDEVGVIIVAIDKDGLLRFQPSGGLDPRILIGKPLWIGQDKTPGVIGNPPPHLTRGNTTVPSIDSLRIDIGASSQDAARGKVKPGERATFATSFTNLGSTLRGKALDDRVGVAILIELLRGGPYPFQFTAAFTVQEEVGLRGAKVTAYAVDPDAALVFEATPAHDLPPEEEGEENTLYSTRLEHGPAISLADRSTLHDRRLIRHFAQTAEKNGIPYQYRQPGGGSNDAGTIHTARGSIPSVGISVPARYIHSPAALVSVADVANTMRLAQLGLEALTPDVYRSSS